MDMRREVTITIGGLAALVVLLAFGAVGLLARMGPAIDHILLDNVASIVAAQDMVALLAEAQGRPLSEPKLLEFSRAFDAALNNVTEPGETALLDVVQQKLSGATSGNREDVKRTVQALHALMDLNRSAMVRADAEAQRLGVAGRWSAVVVALAALAFAMFALRRLQRRFVAPMDELHDVLLACRKGDAHRRCRLREAPEEMRRTFDEVNRLLDLEERFAHTGRDLRQRDDELSRLALVKLLEANPEPAVVVEASGSLLAANGRAMEHLAGEGGEALRLRLGDLPRESPSEHPAEWRIDRLGHGRGWLVRFHSPEFGPAAPEGAT
jgi:methyl-accepting chemotaxis protein